MSIDKYSAAIAPLAARRSAYVERNWPLYRELRGIVNRTGQLDFTAVHPSGEIILAHTAGGVQESVHSIAITDPQVLLTSLEPHQVRPVEHPYSQASRTVVPCSLQKVYQEDPFSKPSYPVVIAFFHLSSLPRHVPCLTL